MKLLLAVAFVASLVAGAKTTFPRYARPDPIVAEVRQVVSTTSAVPTTSAAPSSNTSAALSSTTSAAPSSTATVLNCLQVHQPVLTPAGFVTDGAQVLAPAGASVSKTSCSVLLMEHSFGFSYGKPFLGDYVPPSCSFNRVVMNFTVTSRGRQFDRLALMYFGDTEVWRTSTAEPTTRGIIWTYTKDMSEYLYFWKQPQRLIFDLGNLIDDTYTGFFNTTLTATFFTVDDTPEAASLIIPVSARRGSTSSPSVFMVPADKAINTITLPQNANRAIFSVSACGQASEEFWYANALQSNTKTFLELAGELPGYSPWREVQVYIDGQLAGVHWPFPILFTGGVVPTLWRPVVGIDAFDLREHEIDITPWLGVLSDGKEHTFEIKVAGITDDGGTTGTIVDTVDNSWYVTGKIFLWQDSASSITTGAAPTLLLPAPAVALSQHLTQVPAGTNDSLAYTTQVTRSVTITSTIKTASGSKQASWTQSLSYTNSALYTGAGSTQIVDLNSTGSEASPTYRSTYSYPFHLNSSYIQATDGNFTLTGDMTRGLHLTVLGTPTFPTGIEPPNAKPALQPSQGSFLSTTQSGFAYLFSSASTRTSLSYGNTAQDFSFGGVGGGSAEVYKRSVETINQTLTKDKETYVGADVRNFILAGKVGMAMKVLDVAVSPRKALGRGPG